MSENLEALVQRAAQGDKAALDAVLREIKDDVYKLSMRMLGHPSDAEDATQEVLIKVLTHLGSFRGDSASRLTGSEIHCAAISERMTPKTTNQALRVRRSARMRCAGAIVSS